MMYYEYRKSKINLFRIIAHRLLEKLRQDFINHMNSGRMEILLEVALKVMSLLFFLSPEYRKSIEGFNGVIAFKTDDGVLGVTAVFCRRFLMPALVVKSRALPNANVTIDFCSGKEMASFITQANPDIISGMLDNKLNFNGNLNYILRFVFLARDISEIIGIDANK